MLRKNVVVANYLRDAYMPLKDLKDLERLVI
jgi:hypothetical protein